MLLLPLDALGVEVLHTARHADRRCQSAHGIAAACRSWMLVTRYTCRLLIDQPRSISSAAAAPRPPIPTAPLPSAASVRTRPHSSGVVKPLRWRGTSWQVACKTPPHGSWAPLHPIPCPSPLVHELPAETSACLIRLEDGFQLDGADADQRHEPIAQSEVQTTLSQHIPTLVVNQGHHCRNIHME